MSIDEAISFIKEGRLDDAIAVADKAIAFDPRNVFAIQWRSWAYHRLGRYALALSDISHCIQRETNAHRSSILYAQRALIHAAMLEYPLARHDAHRSVEYDGGSWLAAWVRSRMRCQAADLHGALHDADKSIELFPDQPPLLLNRAHLNRRLDRIDDAVADLVRIAQLDPTNQFAILLHESIAIDHDNYDLANHLISKVHRVDLITLIHRIDIVTTDQSLHDLIDQVESALVNQAHNSPDRQSMHRALAMSSFRLGDDHLAINHAQFDITNDLDLLMIRSLIYMNRDQLQLAQLTTDRAIQIASPQRSVMMYFLRGKIQRRANQPALALASFKHAAALMPSSAGGQLAHRAAQLVQKELFLMIQGEIGDDYQSNVSGWSVSRVQSWLRSAHLGLNVAHQFDQFGVDGTALINLDEHDLISIGITIPYQRRQILDMIDTLRRH